MERVDTSNIRALRGPQGERGPRGPQGERGGVAIVAASEPEPDELGSMWYNPWEADSTPGPFHLGSSAPSNPEVKPIWFDPTS